MFRSYSLFEAIADGDVISVRIPQRELPGSSVRVDVRFLLEPRHETTRSFERRFQLADHVHVTGAVLENGLLHVDLVREIPEAKKPRNITISGGENAPQVVDGSASKVAA